MALTDYTDAKHPTAKKKKKKERETERKKRKGVLSKRDYGPERR